jgi:hypothetical protein
MDAGTTDHVWTIEEIAAIMDANYIATPHGPDKKRISNEFGFCGL